jgi:mono/diheme cytochrome c family protein
VPDRQYFAETRGLVQIPGFLTTRSFLRAASRYETLPRAKSYLRQLNAKRQPAEQLVFFSYKSRHLGTPDSDESYGRLLVVVPGNAGQGVPEKWVQFGVPDPDRRARVRNVSVVSTIAHPDGTSSVYFKDFYRTFRRDGSIRLKGRWELGYGDDSCVQCHKSGILPVFPVAGSVSPDELQAVEEVNRRFRGYGSPRFDKYMDETKLGPGLGSATLADRNGRFGEDFVNSAVGRAMTCAGCHQSDGLGALNWPMDRVVISSYVQGGMMPFGSALDDAQRGELYEKLMQEYFAAGNARPGILKSWLLGKLR